MSDRDPRNDPAPWLERWNLAVAGERIVTHSSVLVPARQGARPVMLKLTQEPDEQIGASVLAWWNGAGAVEVLEQGNGALLMERPTGSASLYQWALDGNDAAAIEVLCQTAATLHAHHAPQPPAVPNMERWFRDLLESTDQRQEIIEGRRLLQQLLATERDTVVLHGDLHHRNVLATTDGRWLAIDPKGIVGERTFDYVNIFRNPNTLIAVDPDRFDTRVDQIVRTARLDRRRLLQWIVAFCALSLAWNCYPEGSPDADLAISRLALDRLDSYSRYGIRKITKG